MCRRINKKCIPFNTVISIYMITHNQTTFRFNVEDRHEHEQTITKV